MRFVYISVTHILISWKVSTVKNMISLREARRHQLDFSISGNHFEYISLEPCLYNLYLTTTTFHRQFYDE
jgi:hypothetical protein